MPDIKVSFQDFRAAYEELKAELDEAYHRFMERGWYVLGKEVALFEDEYAAYCDAKHCVGVGNGLDALHLGLRAVDCGPGDEVIVASNTYIATWLAVTQVGSTVVPVEPCEKTYNLNPELIEQSITSRTKVILATNLYGQPCDYDAIRAVADRHGLIFAMDNAQAQGALYKGRKVGGIADFECHSFYPSKNLGAFGEAGAVTSTDPNISNRVRVMRNYGSRVRYHNEVIGYNSRLDELQAAFLRVKLRHLDEWNARRKALASVYLFHLSDLSSQLFSISGFPLLPTVPVWADPVWHLFVIRHTARDALQKHLADHGIQTIIHYPIPPHLSDAYASLNLKPSVFPIAEKMAKQVLSLPIGPHTSLTNVETVATALNKFRN
jgi:dTDP-4-amino-4,6-dideoxygalactose transaminase